MKKYIWIIGFMVLITCLPVLGQWDKSTGNATITQTIEAGNTTEAPSSDAVNDALALKMTTSDYSSLLSTVFDPANTTEWLIKQNLNAYTGTPDYPLVALPSGAGLAAGNTYWFDGLLADPLSKLVTISARVTIAFVADTKTVTDSGNGFANIVAGMRVTFDGSTLNDGNYIVATWVSAGEITVNETLVDEAATASITTYVYNRYPAIRTSDESWVWGGVNEIGNLYLASLTTTETEYLPISYCIDGAAAPDALATVASTNGKANVRTFAGDSSEDCYMKWDVPEDIDITSGIKIQIKGVITAATGPSNEGISFELSGFSLGDGDALNGTFGTVVELDKTAMTEDQYDNIVTGYSSALTATNITNFAAGEQAQIKILRDHDDDADTYAQLIGIEGIKIKYVRKHDTTF
jgi:hypothetical protein